MTDTSPRVERRPLLIRPGINGAVARDIGLSPTLITVLSWAATGRSNGQIALEMNIQYETVKSHFYRIFQLLKIGDRTGAVCYAIQRGALAYPSDQVAFGGSLTALYECLNIAKDLAADVEYHIEEVRKRAREREGAPKSPASPRLNSRK